MVTTVASLRNLPGNVYVKCIEKRCRMIIGPKLEDAQCGFHQLLYHSRKFSTNLRSIPKVSAHVLLNLRKHMTGFLAKSFGECCKSMVLKACDWPACHCISAQTFVFKSAELNHNHSPSVLDYNKVA